MAKGWMDMDGQDAVPDISVVVPTLNEAESVDSLLTRLFQAFHEDGRRIEVLFADGGSTDGTQERAKAWTSRAPVRVLEVRSGRGLAGDVMTAVRHAQAEVVLVMDGDLSHSPEDASALARPVLEGSRDMVIGSRYVPGGQTPGWPWRRRVMSRIAGALVWPLTDVRDPTSGFFAVRRDKFLRVGDDAEGFKIGLEVLLRNAGDLRVSEVPIRFDDRSCGQSKMGLRQAACYLRRSIALTGGAAIATTAGRFMLVGLLGLALDIGLFHLLTGFGASLAISHILSFLSAATVGYAVNRRWVFEPPLGRPYGPETLLRFVTVCLMALFLRGGVLALLTQRAAWPIPAALIAAALTAAIVNCAGSVFFVFRQDHAWPSVLSWRMAAVGLIGYTILLRLVYLGLPDLLPEEAYYWNYAQHPAPAYLDHPPMVAWLIGLGTAAFGDTEFGVRLGAFVCWFATAGFCLALSRDLFDKGTALVAAMLAAVLPFFFVFGFFMTPDAPLTACWAGTLFFLERTLLAGRKKAWWGVGTCLGLGMLSKYTIVLLAPAALAFILLDRPSRRWLRRPEPYLAALLAALLFSPVILWNARHDWASFLFQSAHRLGEESSFGLPLLLVSMVLLITPPGLIDAFRAVFAGTIRTDADDPAREKTGRQQLFLAIFTIAPLAVFVLFSLRHEVRLSWTGPLWLAALPAIAARILAAPVAIRSGPRAIDRQFWPLTLAATVLLFGGFLHYLAIGFPGVGSDDGSDPLPVAWEELGRDVQQLAEKTRADLGIEPLVVGMDKYALASELAFYRRPGRQGVEQTSSRHLFGGSGLMYGFWFPPRQHAGRTLLLISLNRKNLERPNIPRWARLDPVEERSTAHYGRHVRYFYRIAHDYRPPPPEECSWTSR